MANSILTIDMITRKALEILENNLAYTQSDFTCNLGPMASITYPNKTSWSIRKNGLLLTHGMFGLISGKLLEAMEKQSLLS